jgi:hypothetical protein
MDISWISAFLASLHKLESAHELVGLEKFLQLTTITGRHRPLGDLGRDRAGLIEILDA